MNDAWMRRTYYKNDRANQTIVRETVRCLAACSLIFHSIASKVIGIPRASKAIANETRNRPPSTMAQRHSTAPLILFILVVALSTSSIDAQRLRGVLKRPFHEITTAGIGSADKSSLRGDKSDVMGKMAKFDELIWKMAAISSNHEHDADSEVEASSSNNNNNDDTNHHRSLRWRKWRINANEDSNRTDESAEGPDGPWESCLQKDAMICTDHIKLLNDNLNVVILPYGSVVTMDFRTDRVRVFVDENNVVKMTPRIS